MTSPRPGNVAPDFTLPDDTGAATSLKSFRGKPVILYFIPKAGSPGCTEQACTLEAGLVKLGDDVAVVGVAPDSQRKLANFRKKNRLGFTLLSDADHIVAKQYGVWISKLMFGHRYMGMERVTLILDERGRIVKDIRGITPKEQAVAAAAEVRRMRQAGRGA